MYSGSKKIDLFNKICNEISKGKSLREVLRGENMPHHTTFFKWVDESKENLAQYTRATEMRADAIFEDIIEIADSTDNDVIEIDGKELTNHHVINRDRLRVDSRKWYLSKLMPKKYGDALKVEHDGSIEITVKPPQLNVD